MALKREGAVFLVGVAVLAVIIALLFLPRAVEADLTRSAVRFFGLYGYLFLSIAVLLTPFLREVTQAFGRPFLKAHHSFAVLGVVFITLHPVFNAIERLSLSVFVPRFDSWNLFWLLAGRPAFIILYIAVFAAFLRVKTPKYWRAFHALMYAVLLFGIVHANLIGGDFQNLGILVIFNTLFAVSLTGFAFKRYRSYQLKKKMSR
jgi:DMSO/TMAO reductase YedYZ heme-binding membrane subunit